MTNSTAKSRDCKKRLAELLAEKLRREQNRLWRPFPGPQTQAFHSPADELFYGGAAGGGKTDLLLGLAITAHKKTLLLRREAVQLTRVVERLKRIAKGGAWRSSGHGGTMRLAEKTIELAGCEHEDNKDKYQGHDDDLKLFDELPHFSRTQYRFIIGWNRTDDPRQRCRVVGAGNPPTRPEDRWVVEEWAPWLDAQYHEPAAPGELRWYTVIDEKTVWLPDGSPVMHKGEKLFPRSRTFIPARIQDNPVYMATGYMATLQAMPEPLRSQMLYGDFTAGTEDDAWQMIPTAWVRAAQARWTEAPPEGQTLNTLGADVAYGGADSTCVVARRGPWFARPKKYRGADTDSGQKAAALVLREHDGDAAVNVDVIGYGAACYEALRDKIGKLAIAVNVAGAPDPLVYDKSKKYKMTNIRTAMYWTLREALDPETGDNLMLPPDPEVLADLTAARYEVRAGGIAMEKKEDIKERLGRSPDVGDAVALAHWQVKYGRFKMWFSEQDCQPTPPPRKFL